MINFSVSGYVIVFLSDAFSPLIFNIPVSKGEVKAAQGPASGDPARLSARPERPWAGGRLCGRLGNSPALQSSRGLAVTTGPGDT